MRRTVVLTSVLLACGWLAASCGGDSESDSASGGGGSGNQDGGGSGGTSATGGSGGGTAGAGGGAAGMGGSGGVTDSGAQCGSMTCAADQACCPGLDYCYPATCSNCCPSVIDGGGGGGTGGTTGDGGPQKCGTQTCGPNQSCCSLGSINYCYQTSCTFCCQSLGDSGFGGWGGFDGGFGGFGGFDAGFGGFGNFGGFDAGFDASFGGFGNFGGGSGDGGTKCGSMTCGNGFACCKNQYCYPSACLACCQP